jgi:hypothetical protein
VSSLGGLSPSTPVVVPDQEEGFRLDWGALGPVALAAVVVTAAAYAITTATPSAWRLLGAGRGLVPEPYYPLSGFVIVLATALGQFVGWAAASGLLAHAWGLVTGRPVTGAVVRGAMAVVYLGLVSGPLLAFHVLFGQPLLGLAREGLEAWLAASHPDAHLLLYRVHPIVDLSLVPLSLAVLGILWWARDDRLGQRALQFLVALLILGTSLAVALSLAVHSVLAHVRIGT